MNPDLVLEASKGKSNSAKGGERNHTQLLHPERLLTALPPDRGLDVSSAQAPTNTSLLTLLKSGTYKFQIVKATEGKTLRTTTYGAHRTNGATFKLRHGAYHFAWPSNDGTVEAAWFVSVAALKPGEIACCDLENWGGKDATGAWPYMAGISWAQRIQYALDFAREVKRLTGATTVFYMNWDWIKNFRTSATVAQWNELCTYPLWLADYDSNAPGVFPSVNPKVTGGPTFYVWLHQWTASKPANDGGLDGDMCLDPSLWNTYAVPEDELMSDAQYAELKKIVTDLATVVATINNRTAQGASDADVKAIRTRLDLLEQTILTEQAKLPPVIQQLGTNLQKDLFAIGTDLDERVGGSVRESLRGFQIVTTTQFPTS